MEGSPLEAAYSAARKADKATLNGDYSKASDHHSAASVNFTKAIETTSSDEARRTLDVLARQHLSRSKFLSNQKNLTLPTKPDAEPSKSELASSLANARGIQRVESNPTIKANGDDPFFKFYNNLNNSFQKSFKTAVRDETKRDEQKQRQNVMGSIYSTNESFYVVPNTTNLSPEELITENASLRNMINRTSIQLHAYESAMERQKDAMKTSLVQLKNDIATREVALKKKHLEEVEELQQENEKLKQQNSRLKTRWVELKESARKRREDDEK